MGVILMEEPKLLQYELVDTDKLIPYANNSRTHTDEQIAKVMASIKEFGFINPILITDDYVITAGHARLIAAQRLGLKQVPCIKENYLTPAQRKAYVIADNRLALDAGWDEEMLKVELSALQDQAFDVSITGFDEKELDALFRDPNETVHDDEYDVDDALEQPSFAKRGDIWLVGRHRLMCGDSTKQEDVDALMDNAKADLYLTDPPYNVNYGSRGKLYKEKGGYDCGINERTILNDNMEDTDFRNFLVNAFKCADSAMKKGASFYIFHSDSEGYNFRGACHDVGWNVRQCLIWAKNAIVLGRQDYQWKHEPCLYGWKDGASHSWYSDRSQTTILNFDRPKNNDLHPTMKPLALFGYLAQNSTKKDDIILDLFGGSGTALITCESLERICYMMELDDKYVSVIVRRYIEYTGRTDDIYCLRDGKKIPYNELVNANEETQEVQAD